MEAYLRILTVDAAKSIGSTITASVISSGRLIWGYFFQEDPTA